MQLERRPYLTAGVALVGASMISVSPIVAAGPTIEAPAVQLLSATDAAMDLVGSLDPGPVLDSTDPTTPLQGIEDSILSVIQHADQYISQAAIAVGFLSYGLLHELASGLDWVAGEIAGFGSLSIFQDVADVFTRVGDAATMLGQDAVDYASSGFSPVVTDLAHAASDLVTLVFAGLELLFHNASADVPAAATALATDFSTLLADLPGLL